MKGPVFSTAGDSQALRHAANALTQWGYCVRSEPDAGVSHLLLPVPSFEKDGILKGGIRLEDALRKLPSAVTVLGGNLPSLPCRAVDFLKDEHYLWENAAITAQCALALIRRHQKKLAAVSTLIVGWGRIGKQLAALMTQSGASVTIAARKEQDRQLAAAQSFDTVEPGKWNLQQYGIIVNTAPAPLLSQEEAAPDALLMDLASVRGIEGDRVIWARGLPSKEAPDDSGLLMAKTALRYALGKEHL